MKTATLYDLLQAEAKSTYRLWCDHLRLLREITDPKARQMHEQDIHGLYAKAQELMSTGHLNPVELPKIKVILSRPCEEWVILHRNTTSQVVPTY